MALYLHFKEYMNKFIVCLILGFSLNALAGREKKSVQKKRIVPITFSAESKGGKKNTGKNIDKGGSKKIRAKSSVGPVEMTKTASNLKGAKNKSKAGKKKEVVEVAFGASSLEEDLEPIVNTKILKDARSTFIGPPAPSFAGASDTERNLASYEEPQLIFDMPKETPSLNKLLKKYKNNFANDSEDEDDYRSDDY